MKTPSKSPRQLFNVASILTAFAVLLLLPTVSGCATKAQVRSLNLAVAQSMLPGASSVNPKGEPSASGDWKKASADIDAFIEANPNANVVAKALRIRQAMLLLQNDQYVSARAAFSLVKDTKGLYARDKALKNLDEYLVWWFEQDKDSAPDAKKSIEASEKFGEEISTLSQNPENTEIRDLLAQMRAHIDLHRLKHAGPSTAQKHFIDAVDHYAETLTDEDIQAVLAGKPTSQDEGILPSTKRQIRAMQVIELARERSPLEAGDPMPAFKSPNSVKLWDALKPQ